MKNERPQPRRVKVTVEAFAEITDEAALEQAVVAHINATEFHADEGSTVEEVRAQQREVVLGDPVAAVGWMADPFGVVPDLPGIEVNEGTSSVAEVDEHGTDLAPAPDFVALFPLCRCAKDSCAKCSGFQLTPRTATALWTIAQILADQAYDDVEKHGDQPVVTKNEWELFDRYPPITWMQNAVWRRQAGRAYDDLTADLEAGKWPCPRCPAEEMALHLILRDVPAAVDDGWAGLEEEDAQLPAHPDDFNWDLAQDVLVQDTDILALFNPDLDGIEDPDGDLNLQMSIGDYRPQAWFETFANMELRDGRRPFRR
jgi:hypothetical protein